MMERRPPRLRLFEDDRRVVWLELLFDLVFVVAVAELAGLLHHLSIASIAKYLVLFTVVWWVWIGFTLYANRFGADGTGHRLLAAGTMLAVAGMAAAVGDLDARGELFALSYVGARALLIAAYVRIALRVDAARDLARTYATGFTISAAIWLASVGWDGSTRYAMWAVAAAIDIATPQLALRHQRRLPPQPQHLPERFGLFVVIVVGEVVAAIVAALKGHDLGPAPMLLAAAGILAAVSFTWLYFDRIEQYRVLDNQVARLVWIYSHLPLAASVAAFGVGVEHVMVHPGGGTGWALLAGALAVALGCLAAQRFSTHHKTAPDQVTSSTG
jgi:low temperature requirement protein LtrA